MASAVALGGASEGQSSTSGWVDPVSGVVFHADPDSRAAARPAARTQMAVWAERPQVDLYTGVVYRGDEGSPGDAPGHPAFDTGDVTLQFGRRDYTALTFGFGVAPSDSSTDYQGYATYSWFPADEFELSWTVSGWFFDQEEGEEDGGDQTGGLNFAFGARLYFLDVDRPTDDQIAWYLSAGIGVLVSGQDVPEDGSEFNFTPTAGGGVSVPLSKIGFDDSRVRLDVGVRWHHISNASQFGTDNNPDRDAVLVYAGLAFPL
ncbi:MAG: acyloxyacyl hydrolase [Planctomycetota bacterium]